LDLAIGTLKSLSTVEAIGRREFGPHVNRLRVMTPWLGHVWKEIWLSKRTPTQLTPAGCKL
jgi:hypothetical protein